MMRAASNIMACNEVISVPLEIEHVIRRLVSRTIPASCGLQSASFSGCNVLAHHPTPTSLLLSSRASPDLPCVSFSSLRGSSPQGSLAQGSSEVDRDLACRRLTAEGALVHLRRATLTDGHVAARLKHHILERVRADCASECRAPPCGLARGTCRQAITAGTGNGKAAHMR